MDHHVLSLKKDNIIFGVNFNGREYSPHCNVNCVLRFVQTMNELHCSNSSNKILEDVTFKQLKKRIKDATKKGQYQSVFEQSKVHANLQVILTGPTKKGVTVGDQRFFTEPEAAFKRLQELDFFRSIQRSQYCGFGLEDYSSEEHSIARIHSSRTQRTKTKTLPTRKAKPKQFTLVNFFSPNGINFQIHCQFDGYVFKGVDLNDCHQVLDTILLDDDVCKIGHGVTEKALRVTNSLKQEGPVDRVVTNLLEVGRIIRFFKKGHKSTGMEMSSKMTNSHASFKDIKKAANQSLEYYLGDVDPREWPEAVHQFNRLCSALALLMLDKMALFLSKVLKT